MRSFIAVELDDAIRRKLADVIRQLQRHGLPQDVKWVRAGNIHLTLKFLGDVEDNLLPEICRALTELAGQFDPFEFEISGLGRFPPRGAARVIWCGIEQGAEDLEALAEAVDIACNELGFPLENRKFSPHLTLARIKAPRVGHEVREALEKINAVTTAPGENIAIQSVDQITLFHSELTRSGPVYTPMHHAPLLA